MGGVPFVKGSGWRAERDRRPVERSRAVRVVGAACTLDGSGLFCWNAGMPSTPPSPSSRASPWRVHGRRTIIVLGLLGAVVGSVLMVFAPPASLPTTAAARRAFRAIYARDAARWSPPAAQAAAAYAIAHLTLSDCRWIRGPWGRSVSASCRVDFRGRSVRLVWMREAQGWVPVRPNGRTVR